MFLLNVLHLKVKKGEDVFSSVCGFSRIYFLVYSGMLYVLKFLFFLL